MIGAGPLELLAGALFIVGLVAGAITPVLALSGAVEPIAALDGAAGHLLRTHGRAYAEYASRVGRFVPGVGLIRAS
jgi:protein-S-isoprenylcysteine O-methyltransferase Ste14